MKRPSESTGSFPTVSATFACLAFSASSASSAVMSPAGRVPSGKVNDVSTLKPYCFAAEELGSRGLPERVYPSPVSLTFAGKGLPWRQSLMKCF